MNLSCNRLCQWPDCPRVNISGHRRQTRIERRRRIFEFANAIAHNAQEELELGEVEGNARNIARDRVDDLLEPGDGQNLGHDRDAVARSARLQHFANLLQRRKKMRNRERLLRQLGSRSARAVRRHGPGLGRTSSIGRRVSVRGRGGAGGAHHHNSVLVPLLLRRYERRRSSSPALKQRCDRRVALREGCQDFGRAACEENAGPGRGRYLLQPGQDLRQRELQVRVVPARGSGVRDVIRHGQVFLQERGGKVARGASGVVQDNGERVDPRFHVHGGQRPVGVGADAARVRIGETEQESVLKGELSVVEAQRHRDEGDRGGVGHDDEAAAATAASAAGAVQVALGKMRSVDDVSDLNEQAETVVQQTLCALAEMIDNVGTNLAGSAVEGTITTAVANSNKGIIIIVAIVFILGHGT